MCARYRTVGKAKGAYVFDFSGSAQLPIFELVAMGSMIDLRYIRKHFPQVKKNPGLVPHFFNLLVSKGAHVGIINNDPLVHFSAQSMRKYLKKIRSRVVSNIFTSATEGFHGRQALEHANTFKKYLFIPYALTLVLPLMDGLYLAVTRRRIGYILHLPLSIYTVALIVYFATASFFRLRPRVKSYGV